MILLTFPLLEALKLKAKNNKHDFLRQFLKLPEKKKSLNRERPTADSRGG